MCAKCVVCDDNDEETSDNPIFVCEDCSIGVHKLCYGITTPSGDADPWWCSPCSIGRHSEAICELCSQSCGALKRTTCGRWVHVICSLFIEGTMFKNKNRMEPVDISSVAQKNHGKKCNFCSKVCGVCCKCSEPNCDQFLHVTCGQKNKCLKEKTNPKNHKIIFEAFCRQHKPKASSRRISSVFITETLAAKDNQHQPNEKYYDIIETVNISSDSNDTTLNSSSDDKFKGANDSKGNDLLSDHSVVEHTVATTSPTTVTKNLGKLSISSDSSSQLMSSSSAYDNNDEGLKYQASVSDISFNHSTNISSINNNSTTRNADEDTDINKNAFWWDYLELRKREDELEAQLLSKDEKIDKVKNIIILSLKKKTETYHQIFFPFCLA